MPCKDQGCLFPFYACKSLTPTHLILEEQQRQVEKWGDQRAHPDDTWLRILVEEVGEIAKALNEEEPDEALEAEIVQVAAVCATWLESRWRRGNAVCWAPGPCQHCDASVDVV